MSNKIASHKVTPASTILHYLDLFELSYLAYMGGEQNPNEISPLLMSPFDFEADTMVFCAYDQFEIVGSITVHRQQVLPFDDYFNRHDYKELNGRQLAEISRLIIKESYKNKVSLLTELFSWAYIYATHIHKVTDFVIEVANGHASYYENSLGFSKLDSCTKPFDSTSSEIVLLVGDLSKVKNQPEKYPFIWRFNESSQIEKQLKSLDEKDFKEKIEETRSKFLANYPQPIIEFVLPKKISKKFLRS